MNAYLAGNHFLRTCGLWILNESTQKSIFHLTPTYHWIALILAGYIVHVVVANFRNKEDARGKGDNRRNINDPGIIF